MSCSGRRGAPVCSVSLRFLNPDSPKRERPGIGRGGDIRPSDAIGNSPSRTQSSYLRNRPTNPPGLSSVGDGHRFPLGDTGWSIWRSAVLRSTGFPASGLDRFRDGACADAATLHCAGELTFAEFQARYTEGVTACGTEVQVLLRETLFREAVTWQNPGILRAFDGLLSATKRNSDVRRREIAVSRYWQRYVGKCETIGFFGPTLWVSLDPIQTRTRMHPGPTLTARREVFLEPWAVATYGTVLAKERAIRPWLAPAAMPHHVQEGETVRRPGLPPVHLTYDEARVLKLCDGSRQALDVVYSLLKQPSETISDLESGYAIIDDLARRRLLIWDMNLPFGPEAENVLIDRISAISDRTLRKKAFDGLDRLRRAKSSVADAAGNPSQLEDALEALDVTFSEVTSRPARRRHGQTYAGRTLCYEDTTRDLEVVVGRNLLEPLAPALAVVLQSARWLTNELATAYESALHTLFSELRVGTGNISLADMWDAGLDLFWGSGPKPRDEVMGRFASRWAAMLGLDSSGVPRRADFTSGQLLALLPDYFPCERPGWSLARIHSPDLHLCAASSRAIGDGDCEVVLGEMHIAYSTLCNRSATWALSDPLKPLELSVEDYGQPRIVPLLPPRWFRDSGRLLEIDHVPSDVQLGVMRVGGADLTRVIPTSCIGVVMSDDKLVGVMPDGSAFRLLEYFGVFLSMLSANALREVVDRAHFPRVTVDRLVVFREAWQLTSEQIRSLLAEESEAGRYAAFRRLAMELDLPDRFFIKVSTEAKPLYVDLRSPLYVASCCSMVRAGWQSARDELSVGIVEMLPTPEQAWVPDSDGRRYFGELRTQVTDPARPLPL